jgi:hypothetical protein
MMRTIGATICLLATAGCTSYLGPYEDRPLPARSVPTTGGGRLEVRDGEVSLHVGQGDIAQALGVELAQDDAGVLVTRRLRADAELAPGDRILSARAWDGEADVSDEEPVRVVSDLAGYTRGLGWVVLELRVMREGAEVVVKATPRDEEQKVCLEKDREHDSGLSVSLAARLMGAEVVSLATWPEAVRPAGARASEHLVTRVSECSPAALAGLRPADVIVNSVFTVDGGEPYVGAAKTGDFFHQFTSVEWLFIVRDADGRERGIRAERSTRPWDVWIPGVFSYQSDGIRSHVGLGPTDALLHWSTRPAFSEGTYTHQRLERFSFLTAVQVESTNRAGGGFTRSSFQPVIDLERFTYHSEWKDGVLEDTERFHWDVVSGRHGL